MYIYFQKVVTSMLEMLQVQTLIIPWLMKSGLLPFLDSRFAWNVCCCGQTEGKSVRSVFLLYSMWVGCICFIHYTFSWFLELCISKFYIENRNSPATTDNQFHSLHFELSKFNCTVLSGIKRITFVILIVNLFNISSCKLQLSFLFQVFNVLFLYDL